MSSFFIAPNARSTFLTRRYSHTHGRSFHIKVQFTRQFLFDFLLARCDRWSLQYSPIEAFGSIQWIDLNCRTNPAAAPMVKKIVILDRDIGDKTIAVRDKANTMPVGIAMIQERCLLNNEKATTTMQHKMMPPNMSQCVRFPVLCFSILTHGWVVCFQFNGESIVQNINSMW